MAMTLFAQIKLSTQGFVKGSGTGDRADWIPLTDLSYNLAAQIDASNGSPLGHRLHKPIELTAAVGPHTPELVQALVDNEQATSWTVEYVTPGANGTLKTVLRLSGANAVVATCDIGTDESGAHLVNYFSLSYQQIRVEWLDGGLTAEDDWLNG
jgi:type VI secretion system Hcp family effector